MMARVEHLAEGVTLYLGDCRDILPGIERADALVTSPPYNCGKDYGTADDDLPVEEYKALLRVALCDRARVSVVNVGQYVGSRETRQSLPSVISEVMGGYPKDEVLWDKGPANGAAWGNYPNSPRIRAQHESILIYGNLQMPTGNGLSWAEWSALTTSIWRVSANVDLKVHPAMMPVEIARRCIALWSDANGTVLDPFMGSGTTGLAAVMMARKFVGIEIEPRYFDIACKRISNGLRQPDLFIERPKPAKQEAMF